jgi:hypothetical protein
MADMAEAVSPSSASRVYNPATFLALLDHRKARRTFPAPTILIVFLATIVIRFPWFGFATYHEDESFYLVFAQAMHHGASPYVDIWDRKPFGLFIIYWLITFLPGNGILAYQALSGLFSFATAYVVYHIARSISSKRPAICAAIAYLACAPALSGAGGQSPIFYNLFIATAVLLLLPSQDRPSFRKLVFHASVAMLSCGIALTIKPTSIVESAFLGAVASWRILQFPEIPLQRRLATIIGYATLGVLPTALILLHFLMLGQFQIYWFATVVSIGLRAPESALVKWYSIRDLTLRLLPFWIIVFGGALAFARSKAPPATKFLLVGWSAAAIGGFLLVPNFWDHYALPLLAPFSVLCAPIFARRGTGLVWMGALLLSLAVTTGWPRISAAHEANVQLSRVASVIETERRGGCVYVFEGAPMIYAVTGGCHVTSRLFPEHLDFAAERQSVGLNTRLELERVLAKKPAVIVTTAKPLKFLSDRGQRRRLYAELRAGYRKVATLPLTRGDNRHYQVEIWALVPR